MMSSSSDPELQEDDAMEVEIEGKRCPFVDIRQWVFDLTKSDSTRELRKQSEEALAAYITENNAAPLYKHLAETVPDYPLEKPRLEELEKKLDTAVKEIEEKIKDAQETQGETEVREAMQALADLYAKAGDKAKALEHFEKTEAKTVGSGQKIDMHFTLLRFALALQDTRMYSEQIKITRDLLERGGGDWERRNLFAVYEAVWFLNRRELTNAANLLLKSVATFSCTDLFDFNSFVRLAVTVAICATDRKIHRDMIINNPDVLGVIDEIPGLRELAFNLFHSKYAEYFRAVVEAVERMQSDWLLGPHAGFLLREMRVVGYKQFLTSYRSVKLQSMSHAFGVGQAFLDQELSRFIGVNRLNCQIDRVAGVVVTTRPGERHRQYVELVRQGDLLMDRVNKLTRIGST